MLLAWMDGRQIDERRDRSREFEIRRGFDAEDRADDEDATIDAAFDALAVAL
jgi:hypothetical protein